MNNQKETFEITLDGAMTIANCLTYNDYAKLKRKYMRAGIERRPSFDEYFVECSKHYEMDMMPLEAWECGYDLVADLFDDNERNGTPCDEDAIFQRNIAETLAMFNNRR